MSDAEVDRYLTHNTDWHTLQGDRTADDVREGIALIRSRGWALNLEAITRGLGSLGTVVHDGAGLAVCAISVAGLEHHYAEPHLQTTAAAVMAAAEEISRRIG
ncbi:IclR family transcriptional regulator domain-containing protein [Acrocarpospora catenulata]|uniref:IclR family transcriptional regulator domain-containing protein n=1 Tax=Acrocarpospora catenulata TaxID=2836182 RepID=UPI001BD9A12A|nr:IclR family transcriptional regulator C-terminal domain-containing protein [Acrocarpospora catenulata]